jgi:hypothetical protein
MTTMSEPGLLPCPFCGCAVQFRKALWPSDGCTDAIIHAEPSECGLTQFDIGTTDERVIGAWNRRSKDLLDLLCSPEDYPMDAPCANCGSDWGEHTGTRCPTGNVSHFAAATGSTPA